jgi:TolA-binding protein
LKVVANLRITAEAAARTESARRRAPGGTRGRPHALAAAALAGLLLTHAGGCATVGGWFDGWRAKRPDPPPAPVETMSLRGGAAAEAAPANAELEGAKRLYYDGDYAKAEPIFTRIVNDKKSLVPVAEEALYYEADCERLRGRYPDAAELYNKLLGSYPMGKHAPQAREHLFNIANYWLDDTRAHMEACRQKKEGKRWWVSPIMPVHWDNTHPVFDTEGHAIRMLEQVYITDPTGPLAEKALFYIASVKFFREDYRDADHYFSQLVEHHPNGKLAPEALRYSIICKQMSTGGSEYDGKLLSEAIDKVQLARASYPELVRERGEFLDRQMYSITQQQADSDFKVAEFYRRTGRPGSAYFYYELVRRRYRGTEYARKATERMAELKQRVDAERAKEQNNGPAPGGAAPETGPAPRPYAPGAPLSPLGNGPAPGTLPPGLLNDRRGP